MSGMSARAALRPGDVLVVRTAGFAAELIRIGEELSGKPGLQNHVAVFHHWTGSVPWGLEGRPGGVGWADLRPYLRSSFTINNCLQPGRDDAGRAEVCAQAERMLGTAYDWEAIADDTLRAFHMADLFASTWHGAVPGHIVCSSYAAFLYERQGWERPDVPDRDTEPADWCACITEHQWSATISVLRQDTEESGQPRARHHRRAHLGAAGPGAAGQPDARRALQAGGHQPGGGGEAAGRAGRRRGGERRDRARAVTTPDPPLPAPGDEAAWWRYRYARDKPMLDEWAAVWVKIPADVQAEISALHEKNMHECCGFAEGQHCCVDFLDGSADAGYRDVISRYEKGKP